MENNHKVLVAYATFAGATKSVAKRIGEELGKTGLTTEVREAKDVHDLSPYDAVVLGSAVRAGSWHGEAKGFLSEHESTLAGLPVALFTVCLTMKEDTPESRAEVRGYMESALEAAPSVKPVDMGMFAGKVDYGTMSFLVRLLMKYIIRAPEGDFRDWERIAEWAREIEPKLTPEA
jgi:menaquinone-dependent protoporphyrinogen oxidase